MSREDEDQTIVYAVGDLHGRRDLLDEMTAWIARDAAAIPCRRRIILSIGDLVDRGPDSYGVVDFFAQVYWNGFDLMAVSGNHDSFLLDALDDRLALATWLLNGGGATLESYGLAESLIGARFGDASHDIPAALRRNMPSHHQVFLRAMPLYHRWRDYVFVHAGLRPGIALEHQLPEDVMWIREPFLADETPRPYRVVHGHTIVPAPEITAHRIGIDTGAWRSGILTCLALSGETRRLRQTGGGAWPV